MAKLELVRAASNNLIGRVFLRNSTSTAGAGLTGLTFSSSGLAISVMRELDATTTNYTVAGSTVQTITTLGTYAAPSASNIRFKEIDATNFPGWYELQFAQALSGAGDTSRFLSGMLFGATNLAPCPFELSLVALNPQSSQTGLDFSNVNLPTGAVKALGILDNGTASALPSGTSLTLASLSFGTNALAGRSLWVFSATTGAGEVVTINSNTNATPSVLSFDAPTIAFTGTVVYILFAQATGSATNLPAVNTTQLAGQTVTAAAGVTFPTSVASPTNITAGTITTTTNLTNAPTSGDFTATMKTSLNAATPASVVGAVGSVTGNVGGNVVGSVASVAGNVSGSVGSVAGNVSGNVAGNVVGSVNSVTTGVTLASGAITSTALATSGLHAMTDDHWNRDMSVISRPGGSTRYPLQAIDTIRNKVDTSVNPAVIYTQDDSTTSYTTVLTTSAGALPIVTSDPT